MMIGIHSARRKIEVDVASETARAEPFPRLLLVTLAVLSSATPFATDLYLPAFLDIQDTFTATASSVQLTLTTFLIGAGLGQVVFGPLSDRLGRRGPLLVGVVLFTLSSIGAALAPSITILIIMRLLQGFSGSAGMVIGRAVVNDMVGGFEAARILNLFMLLGGIAPIIAPVAGSVLADPLGWDGLMWIVAAIGAASLVMALLWVPESHPPHRRTASGTQGGQLANQQFIAATAVLVLSFMTLMAYVSAPRSSIRRSSAIRSAHTACSSPGTRSSLWPRRRSLREGSPSAGRGHCSAAVSSPSYSAVF